jgi:glycosyltransferase involved in cell wall biosynthesis
VHRAFAAAGLIMPGDLVSCILVTRRRPDFVAQALCNFEAQTYRNSELVVVDDGEMPVRALCKDRRRVRYIGLASETPTGTKLNIGIASAAGGIIQKFDDDDYYHPRFLETAVGHLPARNRHRAIVAWDCFLALNRGDPQVRYSGHGWKVGGTLCFTRRLWERAPFRDLPKSVDSWFLRDHAKDAKLVPVCAPDYYVVVRHGRNTWSHMAGGETVEEYFRRLRPDPRPIGKIVAAKHREFYVRLAGGK